MNVYEIILIISFGISQTIAGITGRLSADSRTGMQLYKQGATANTPLASRVGTDCMMNMSSAQAELNSIVSSAGEMPKGELVASRSESIENLDMLRCASATMVWLDNRSSPPIATIEVISLYQSAREAKTVLDSVQVLRRGSVNGVFHSLLSSNSLGDESFIVSSSLVDSEDALGEGKMAYKTTYTLEFSRANILVSVAIHSPKRVEALSELARLGTSIDRAIALSR